MALQLPLSCWSATSNANPSASAQASAKLPRDLRIGVDRKKMIQVLLNLCKNAAEAMPQGGTLTLRRYCSDTKIFLEVVDTGVGIPSELNIFKALTTSKSNGLGIGLAVVEQIVSAHRGSIDYTSELGKRTVFRVTLPLERIEADPSAKI